jgi:molybdopterin molybdotransferase
VKSVDAHLADILEGVEPLPPLHMGLLETIGCVLAEDVVSAVDLPPFDNSSMDGYAVVVADVAGASTGSPVLLPVVGEIAAGSSFTPTVAPGTTVRIMTGAPVPAGAQAVIPQEWTDRGVRDVAISRKPEAGANIRRCGEDVHAGDVVLTRGTTIGPTQIGLLAAVGRARILVHPQPRVVVFSTGSELVEPGEPLGAGQIHDSNSYLLTAAVRELGAIAYRVAALPDDPSRLLGEIEDQLVRADVVLTSGGVSVGAHDVVKEVLSRSGTVEFVTVAMQPGKPQGQGTIGPQRTPIITLPGNPVSAFVSYEVFVRPLLRRLAGAISLHRPTVAAVLTEELRSPAGKRQFMRATLIIKDGNYVVRPVGGPGSHLLGALSQANALIVVPEEVTAVPAGYAVTVMVLDNPRS